MREGNGRRDYLYLHCKTSDVSKRLASNPGLLCTDFISKLWRKIGECGGGGGDFSPRLRNLGCDEGLGLRLDRSLHSQPTNSMSVLE